MDWSHGSAGAEFMLVDGARLKPTGTRVPHIGQLIDGFQAISLESMFAPKITLKPSVECCHGNGHSKDSATSLAVLTETSCPYIKIIVYIKK